MDYSFFVLIIAIFASRFIQFNAFKNLSDEDKGKVLSKELMRLSQSSVLITVGLILAFYILVSKYPDNFLTLGASFFIALMLMRIVTYFFTRKRLNDNSVPSSYISKYFLSWLVTTLGVALFFVLYMQQFNNASVK
jgi:Na+/proline symporter